MTKIKEFLKKFNLFDYIFLPIALIAAVIVSIIFQGDALSIIYSIVGIISLFMLSKGFFFAYFMVIVTYILLAVQSYFNGLYGEAIVNGIIGVALQIYAIIKGFVQKKKGKDNKIVMTKLNPLEWILSLIIVLAISVGVYFMLEAFNTKYLVISTIAFGVNIYSNYLLARGNFFNYVGWIISNMLSIVLWVLPLALGEPNGSSLAPMIVGFVSYLIININGLINWIKLSKKQKEENDGTVSSSGQL